jgi:dipeptidyl aminopeptidase/acylaminoacyl peptidase
VYILHGADDDNVPAAQARQMIGLIEPFHRDFQHHEQPGAGHWWDNSDEPGADCVDWPAMFDFFARHRLPGPHELRELRFVTPNPGVSSRFHWLTVEAQERALERSSASLRIEPQKRRISGTTSNISRMMIDLIQLKPDEQVVLDLNGQVFEASWPAGGRLWLERAGDKWSAIDRPARSLKGPHRNGPFKEAFRNRMTFVYGTQGTPQENAWALAKAKFDAEVWWYRGNGSVPVMSDKEFDPVAQPQQNVILFGNADSNLRWSDLIDDEAVQVRRGVVRVGSREVIGDNLACLFIRPRRGSDHASVAAISGTGPAGFRLSDRLPLFASGVGLPDLIVLSADAAEPGNARIRAAGFFGNDWGTK